jgi:Cys-tRNA(Pro) deacylase
MTMGSTTLLSTSDLQRFINQNDIAATIVQLSTETPTVDLAAKAVGVKPSQIGKSLLFIVSGDPVLVIGNGNHRINYKSLAQYCGVNRKRIRLAKPGQVMALTGYAVGTVPPFGHASSLPTIIEARVTQQDKVYVGGGSDDALMLIETAELLRVTEAAIVSLAG